MSVASGLQCPDDALLRQFLLGQMADAEAESLEQHLESCPSCVARLEDVPASDPLLEAARHCGGEAMESSAEPETVSQLIRCLRQNLPSAGERTATCSWAAGTPELGELDTPREAEAEPMPARIGRYRLLRRLGAGGMGTVYLAEDPELGRTVALKRPRFAGGPEARERARQRFVREARAAAAVRHARVCQIHDVGEQGGTPYVVIDYIDGCSLAERLRRDGRFADGRDAIALAVAIAEGLAAVHTAGIIHRDLKPGNVLLAEAGDAYLTDFGLARWQDDREHLTAEGVLVGTPAYMAPEQLSEEFGPVTPRTDLYSLGVILYQMLTGRLPFAASEPVRLLYQIAYNRPPSPRQLRPDLDPRLEAIVLRAMARRPEDRFADARQLAAALRDWLNAPAASSVAADPPLPSLPPEESADDLRPTLRPRRRRWSWRAAGLLLMVLAGGAAVTLSTAVWTELRAPRGKLDVERMKLDERSAPELALGAEVKNDRLPNSITNSIGMKLVLVKPGAFLMGSPPNEVNHRDDEHQHEVEITRPFYVGVHEVTQEQYQRITGQNPSSFSSTGGGKDKVKGMETREFPVESVSWLDAAEYCRWLSERPEEKANGRGYRLPTEAEWEYACRGETLIKGPPPPFHFGNSLSSTQANFNGNSPYGGAPEGPYLKRTTKVGSYPPNPLGLYDLHGNVWEWCADWYAAEYYHRSPRQDPQGPENGSRRVLRGGSYLNNGRNCRAAYRYHLAPGDRFGNLGFRVVLPVGARN